MPFLHAINWLYTLSGFGVGLLVGVTGVGGGSLMTPLMILLFSMQPVAAVGTDLIYACITKTGGSMVYAFNDKVNWRIVGLLSMGSLPASAATLAILKLLGTSSAAANGIVTKVLAVALVLTVISLLFRNQIIDRYGHRADALPKSTLDRYTVITGIILGVLVTLSSVGASALGVTALILLYPRLPIIQITGSGIVHAVPLTLVAGLGHLLQGSINVPVLVALLIGSLPGIFLGSYLAPRMSDTFLRYALAVTLALVSARLLLM
ncbi:MAG TPA: sulfite exporter TauE/SafE family protein [Rhizomicrobium sp.]|jgi:uncharacterized membrane protein YfcA|nr:sulfite exporter TauE/SafE family protein [Rhizomicrobium sp.]